MTGHERTLEDAEDRESEDGGGERKFHARRMAIGIPRTFTASQFFRLIIQRARMHPGSLGDCIWRSTAVWNFGNGKKRDGNPKSRVTASLKNIIPFAKTTIFITISFDRWLRRGSSGPSDTQTVRDLLSRFAKWIIEEAAARGWGVVRGRVVWE